MKDTIDEVKRRIDIVDFVGSYIQLKRAGRNYKANCPFHNEKTPSFVISPDRQIWRCFGACHDGGDVISFLMKWENITFFEALRELSDKVGISMEGLTLEDRAWDEKKKLTSINESVAKFYHYILVKHPSGKHAREYLEKRGITEKLIETFMLGYAPRAWDTLHSYLTKKGVKDHDMLEAGLILTSKSGTRHYDRFRGRVMFPIYDLRGHTIGFSGRLLSENEKQAKYVNTPETPLYHKRETLYGINLAKDSIIQKKCVYLVEGEFDMISSFKNGITNTVAIKGSSVTLEQLNLLKRITQHIILALDTDFSGSQTTKRAISDAEKLDFRVDVVRIESGKDPDEAMQKNILQYKRNLKKATPIYDFIIEDAASKYDIQDPYEMKNALNEIVPYVSQISNPILKGHYIRKISESFGTKDSDVEALMLSHDRKIQARQQHVSEFKQKEKIDKNEYMQKIVLSMIIQNENPPELLKTSLQSLDVEDYSIPAYSKIVEKLKKYLDVTQTGPFTEKGKTSFKANVFAENLSSPIQKVFDELLLFDVSAYESSEKQFKRLLLDLKRLTLKAKLKDLLESNPHDKTITKLTMQIAKVEKTLHSV